MNGRKDTGGAGRSGLLPTLTDVHKGLMIFMNKQDIIRKLTSRKFWLAVAAFVTELIVAFKGDAATAETVSGMIMAGATVIAYIVGEGLIDAEKIDE